MIYFTADNHFGATRIDKFCRRGLGDNHDQHLISKINETVTNKDDVLYIVGDFAEQNTRDYCDMINCKNLIFVQGNHDEWQDLPHVRYEQIYEDKVVLFHYAIAFWKDSHQGAYHLYGHTHALREDFLQDGLGIGRRSMDIGVDNAKRILGDYVPFSWEFIKEHLGTGHDSLLYYQFADLLRAKFSYDCKSVMMYSKRDGLPFPSVEQFKYWCGMDSTNHAYGYCKNITPTDEGMPCLRKHL